jgi:hypothetical protein
MNGYRFGSAFRRSVGVLADRLGPRNEVGVLFPIISICLIYDDLATGNRG